MNTCIIDINDSTYAELIYLSKKMNITLRELLTKIINQPLFEETIHSLFNELNNNWNKGVSGL